jgi:hypothetical protein
MKGFEPSTSASTEQRSNRLSYTHQTNHLYGSLEILASKAPSVKDDTAKIKPKTRVADVENVAP